MAGTCEKVQDLTGWPERCPSSRRGARGDTHEEGGTKRSIRAKERGKLKRAKEREIIAHETAKAKAGAKKVAGKAKKVVQYVGSIVKPDVKTRQATKKELKDPIVKSAPASSTRVAD